jgi:hypothetical protein
MYLPAGRRFGKGELDGGWRLSCYGVRFYRSWNLHGVEGGARQLVTLAWQKALEEGREEKSPIRGRVARLTAFPGHGEACSRTLQAWAAQADLWRSVLTRACCNVCWTWAMKGMGRECLRTGASSAARREEGHSARGAFPLPS